MKQLNEVLELISNIKIKRDIIRINLNNASRHVLAEDVYSDINMPPFDKSAMDGYACRSSDLDKPLEILEFVGAGSLPTKTVSKGKCTKIMTGAKVPEGADCVIMVEQTSLNSSGKVVFDKKNTKSNICSLGEDVRVNDKVLEVFQRINPSAIATAASVGKTILNVFRPPHVSVIATGDELVEPHEFPDGPFIRNSNAYNLMSQISKTPAKREYFGIVKDDRDELKTAIIKALEKSDILILTGGVSMGDKDFIPELLQEHGLRLEFNKMAIQPGKPVAFAHGNGKYCFALSGNPVSSMLQFELLVRPFIYQFMGANYQLPIIKCKLKNAKERRKTDRMQFFPVRWKLNEATPLEFHGSAHVHSLVKANGLAIFPVGMEKLEINSEIEVLLINQ